MKAIRLRQGLSIGIVSPSAPADPVSIQYMQGSAVLEKMGFPPIPGDHVFSNTLGYAAAPQEKAGDINAFFADDSIQAVICSQGGQTANACLPYLDWRVIANHPKIFLGMSDITVLLNAIFAQTGLVTFHGHDLMWGLGRQPAAYDLTQFEQRLVNAASGDVPSKGPRKTVRAGVGEGPLLGGNLGCLLKLAGTPYFPDFNGAILLIESLDLTPAHCNFMFSQLKQMRVFDRLQGVVIGYNDGLDNNPNLPIKMEDVLMQVAGEYDFPILKTTDFGHNCPNTILPIGARATLDAGSRTLAITEPCLEAFAMTAADVLAIVELFNQHQVNLTIDGGWGVDALLGRQTRIHTDMDIAVEHKDVPRIRSLLEARGFTDVPRDDTWECNFVLGDAQGRQVDIHSYTFDAHGKLVFGVPYPFESLTGTGTIQGVQVRCIDPHWMVQFHTGYPLDQNDYRDVKALCQQFGIPIPEDYAPFERGGT